MIRTIIAPTGAGKTTWKRTHPWCLDGDYVPDIYHVYEEMQKKFGDFWWTKDPMQMREAFAYKDALMSRAYKRLSRKGKYDGKWIATAEMEFAQAGSIFVIPPAPVLLMQQTKRFKEGKEPKPPMPAEVARQQVTFYLECAARYSALVFKSFNQLEKVGVGYSSRESELLRSGARNG